LIYGAKVYGKKKRSFDGSAPQRSENIMGPQEQPAAYRAGWVVLIDARATFHRGRWSCGRLEAPLSVPHKISVAARSLFDFLKKFPTRKLATHPTSMLFPEQRRVKITVFGTSTGVRFPLHRGRLFLTRHCLEASMDIAASRVSRISDRNFSYVPALEFENY
jgi:hypothetical protein